MDRRKPQATPDVPIVIDWWMVGTNSLWILGLSIILAAFSYHDWLAKDTGRRRREVFKTRSWRVPFNGGMVLTCLGWGLAQATLGPLYGSLREFCARFIAPVSAA